MEVLFVDLIYGCLTAYLKAKAAGALDGNITKVVTESVLPLTLKFVFWGEQPNYTEFYLVF